MALPYSSQVRKRRAIVIARDLCSGWSQRPVLGVNTQRFGRRRGDSEAQTAGAKS
jgi:hypothetical protein